MWKGPEKNAFSVCDSVFISVFQRKRTSVAPHPTSPGEGMRDGPKECLRWRLQSQPQFLKHPVRPIQC